MKIDSNLMRVNKSIGFKSVRTDRNTVSRLKTGEKPVIENAKINIYSALNNLSEIQDRNNVEFLLDVANNLKYGQGGEHSEFKAALDKDNITPEERENTKWDLLLKDTIRKALSGVTDEDTSDLETEFNRIFFDRKELTPEQKQVLDLRKKLTENICESALEGGESLDRAVTIRKNLDYFIASSEISLSEKKDCLEKLAYFMSDDYKITPQLEDKKFQVLDEILNDLVIITPEDEILKIKSTDQHISGICASISICRKLLAYEDKSRYIEMITEELKDSPVMSVYDRTELENGKKIEIPKINIDYNAGLRKGFRITDISAHNYMQNAHASGDGSIQTEHYVAFDDEAYGVFDDASWYLNLNAETPAVKLLLMSLIKEKEALESVKKTKELVSGTDKNIRYEKEAAIKNISAVNGEMTSLFSDIFPEKSNKEISDLISDLRKYYEGDKNNRVVNVAKQLPKEVKSRLLVDFLIEHSSDISEDAENKLKKNSDKILTLTEEYIEEDKKLKKAHRINSQRNKYYYGKKLLNLAAAHRLAIESDVNLPDGIQRFERFTGLPPRRSQIINHLKSVYDLSLSETYRARFKDENGNIPSVEQIRTKIAKDIYSIETKIPARTDMILKKLVGQSIKEITINTYEAILNNIKNGDSETLYNVVYAMGLKYDKEAAVKYIQKQIKKIESDPSDLQIDEAIRQLGYNDRIDYASVLINSFFKGLSKGITEEYYQQLVDTFGGEDCIERGLTLEQEKFSALVNEYDDITSRWDVPSQRTLILQKLEKDNKILSRSKLDMLYKHREEVLHKETKNNKIEDLKARKKANEELYKYSEEEKLILRQIEQALPEMKKYCSVSYLSLNNNLKSELENQYADLGMLNGQFWVREEGSSGLTNNEEIRIIEQMTGKPYHFETDLKKAVKNIKQGEGSGIISLSVTDDDYGFHAMYVPAVTDEKVIDPVEEKETEKDILWTDNTWGKSERDKYWNGSDGFYHTDYGSNYGWKRGFFLRDNNMIGLAVDDIDGAQGYSERDKEKFPLFTGMILPGTPTDTYRKLYTMFNYIFTMDDDEKLYDRFEKFLSDKNTQFPDVDYLTGIDRVVEENIKYVTDFVKNNIKSEKDFEKLPDNHPVKFAFNKLRLYLATENENIREDILEITNPDDLDQAYEDMIQQQADNIGGIIAKSDVCVDTLLKTSKNEFSKLLVDDLKDKFNVDLSEDEIYQIMEDIFADTEAIKDIDGSLQSLENFFLNQIVKSALNRFYDEKAAVYFIENAQKTVSEHIDEDLRIKSLESSALVNSPMYECFIAAVDKYLNPKNDDELLQIIIDLQNTDFDTANEFIDRLQPEDLEITLKDAYEYIRKFNDDDYSVVKALSDIISVAALEKELSVDLIKNKNKITDENDEEYTPEELYRIFYIKLADLDVNKYIKEFKEEAFKKYNLRPAFPDPVIAEEEEIVKSARSIMAIVKESIDNIKNNEYVLKIADAYDILKSVSQSKGIKHYTDAMSDIRLSDENEKEVNELKNAMYELYELIKYDYTMTNIAQLLSQTLEEFDNEDGIIRGRVLAQNIKNIDRLFVESGFFNFPKSTVKESCVEEREELKQNLLSAVKANIDPAHRNYVINKINTFIQLYRKDAPEDEIIQAENEFTDAYYEKHITKNPTELLNECVRALRNGEKDTEEYDILSKYLKAALYVAQKTKIEYKLVKNEHEGISSKTKEMLPCFSVISNDGSEESMESDAGMLYLIEKLRSNGKKNRTLNLFLNQSGLSTQALNVVLQNIDFQNAVKLVDEKVVSVRDKFAQTKELFDYINQFIDGSDGNYKNIKSAIKKLTKFVERQYKKSGNSNEISELFLQYVKSLEYNEIALNLDRSMILPYLQIIKTEVLQYIVDNKINTDINFITEIGQLINERMELAYGIDVAENSDEFKARENAVKQVNEVQSYINQNLKQISEDFDKSDIFKSEVYEED